MNIKQSTIILILLFFLLESCAQVENNNTTFNTKIERSGKIINREGTTIKTRFLTPPNYERISENENSFSEYLRSLPLKAHGSEVRYYNGSTKENHNVYLAVLKMKIGNKALHQCADAIMRLKAEYLWKQARYEDIHFNFTNGFRVDYSKWMEGKRIVVEGNRAYWINKTKPSNSYQDFWEYMEVIFTYAGTLSLSKELVPVSISDIKIGDIFIWGASPGHAVLVIDMAENLITKEKIFLLAQSYMPAQETQILQNPNNKELNPWYSVAEMGNKLQTPEWTFSARDLKRFQE